MMKKDTSEISEMYRLLKDNKLNSLLLINMLDQMGKIRFWEDRLLFMLIRMIQEEMDMKTRRLQDMLEQDWHVELLDFQELFEGIIKIKKIYFFFFFFLMNNLYFLFFFFFFFSSFFFLFFFLFCKFLKLMCSFCF